MPLRTPNNPNTDAVTMNALIAILKGYPTANTAAGLNSFPFYVQRENDLLNGPMPAILLWPGRQKYTRSGMRQWQGELTVDVDYYDDWTQRPDQLDDIRAAVAADLERMKANVESNESLAQNNTMYAISAHDHELSPYEGVTREEHGRKLIYRRYTVSFHLLPYDA